MHDPGNVFRCPNSALYGWRLRRSEKIGYKTFREAAKDYVTALIEADKKYLPLIQGRTWKDIFRILGFPEVPG